MIHGNDSPHELLRTTRQITKLRNAFDNNMSTDIKLSKTKIYKIIQSRRFLQSILSKVTVPLAKNILGPLGTAAASAVDTGIQNKVHGSGTTTLIISNEEINCIMKIAQALEDCCCGYSGISGYIKTRANFLNTARKTDNTTL